MTEKELISKLQELKKIEPQKDWVFLTKSYILNQNFEQEQIKEVRPSIISIFQWLVLKPKPALISLVALGLVISTFSFAQNTLPGDPLYSLKIISEKAQSVFVPEKEKPKFALAITDKRLEELDKVAKAGETRRLFPAISAVERSTKKSTKEVSKIVKEEGGVAALKSIEQYVQGKDKTKQVFGSLGIEPKMSQEDEKLYAEFLIADWEKRTLNENQENLLKEAKSFFEKGDYSSVLYILVNQPQLQKEEEKEGQEKEIPQIQAIKLDIKKIDKETKPKLEIPKLTSGYFMGSKPEIGNSSIIALDIR